MKKFQLIIIIVICVFSLKIFSQGASQSYFFTDTTNKKWAQIEYGEKIKVFTNDSIYKGKLDSVSNNIVFFDKKAINIDSINKIRYIDKSKTKSISSLLSLTIGSYVIFGITLVISIITIGLFWYNAGFILYFFSFLFIYSSFFLFFLLCAFIILSFMLFTNKIIGKSIKLKKNAI